MNPILTPVMFNLSGVARGSVHVSGATETIKASGQISPIGPAQVSGTLRIVGNQETGTLKLNSSTSNLNLYVYGTVGGPLHFTISGATNVPHTAFYYRTVDGVGVVNIHLGPGPKGPDIAMAFSG